MLLLVYVNTAESESAISNAVLHCTALPGTVHTDRHTHICTFTLRHIQADARADCRPGHTTDYIDLTSINIKLKTRKQNLKAASSAGRFRRDNVILTFDPKHNQFIAVPRCSNDKNL